MFKLALLGPAGAGKTTIKNYLIEKYQAKFGADTVAQLELAKPLHEIHDEIYRFAENINKNDNESYRNFQSVTDKSTVSKDRDLELIEFLRYKLVGLNSNLLIDYFEKNLEKVDSSKKRILICDDIHYSELYFMLEHDFVVVKVVADQTLMSTRILDRQINERSAMLRLIDDLIHKQIQRLDENGSSENQWLHHYQINNSSSLADLYRRLDSLVEIVDENWH